MLRKDMRFELKNIQGGCWRGYERVPGTIEFSKGSCRKIGSAATGSRARKSSRKSRRMSQRKSRRKSQSGRKPRRKSQPRRSSRKKSARKPRRRSASKKMRGGARGLRLKSRRGKSLGSKSLRSKSRRSKSCTPGPNKKFAKLVNNKCIRFGDPHMTIKKNKPGRKRSFCARHRCKMKRDPQTPGYQSCKKWNCATSR